MFCSYVRFVVRTTPQAVGLSRYSRAHRTRILLWARGTQASGRKLICQVSFSLTGIGSFSGSGVRKVIPKTGLGLNSIISSSGVLAPIILAYRKWLDE